MHSWRKAGDIIQLSRFNLCCAYRDAFLLTTVVKCIRGFLSVRNILSPFSSDLSIHTNTNSVLELIYKWKYAHFFQVDNTVCCSITAVVWFVLNCFVLHFRTVHGCLVHGYGNYLEERGKANTIISQCCGENLSSKAFQCVTVVF